MPFPAEWQGYSPGPYAIENNIDFEMFDFEVQHHSHMGATPISEPPNISQDPKGLSMENPREMTFQSPMPSSNPTPVKGKRVRTGCLTCRERHLKCDEAVPDCMNCRKRGRECKRGVRLNFLDVNLHRPPDIPSPGGWEVEFQDESRDIASEYQGGLGRYAPYASEIVEDSDGRHETVYPATATHIQGIDASADRLQPGAQHRFNYSQDNAAAGPSKNSRFKTDTGIKLELNENEHGTLSDASHIATPSSSTKAVVTPRAEVFPEQLMAMRNRPLARQTLSEEAENLIIPQLDTPPRIERPLVEQAFEDDHMQPSATQSNESVGRNILTSAEEIHYMQVFVEEVAVWMDSFNREKHFTRSIPYHALRSTMLLNALLACGVKHTSLAAPDNHEKALFYYNTATTQLLRSLQNPDRNTAECATTAIVLNVYEIMCEKPAQRMSHIAGSRALVRECGWDARSTGIGLACFWLNIGIEVLNCLATNWQTTWSPDEWGMSLGSRSNNQDDEDEDEQVWVHRALYIIAKVANFRATASRPDDISPHNEQTWVRNRLSQWYELRNLCEGWNIHCPRKMRPFGYVKAEKSTTKSLFPGIWMIQREATIGQLLSHTAHCILSQTHPLESPGSSERLRFLQLQHAYQVCGIVAHTTDKGVATVAIRCLAIAAAVLTNPDEQDEILEVLDRFNSTNGWRLGAVEMELKREWGWERMKMPTSSPKTENSQDSVISAVRRASMSLTPSRILTPPVMGPVGTKIPVNPLSFADFKLPNHPYQNWYEPPSRSSSFNPQPS
ncbi:regulatory protein for the arginine catabolic pathway [Fusarium fujikuroi]|nr:regulatory protein for the arginine catabolic pathway [Fusarium fujikuroi]SCO00856.1 related to regulatory protein for the arginine catabolic pathway [Fusarium fujikuroi]